MKKTIILTVITTGISLLVSSEVLGQCPITVSNTSPCPGESITLTITNPDPGANYQWDFTNNGSNDASGTSVVTSYPYSTTAMNYTVNIKKNGTSCTTQVINVKASPDPSVGLVPSVSSPGMTIQGDTIKICNSSSNTTVAIYNTSTTFLSNASYEINWGEGPVENYTNATFPTTAVLTHNYTGYGYKYITIKVVHANGCYRTKTYVYYSGSNPSVGLTNPGGTVGLCAPHSITFPISNTAGNPPGTIYAISVNGNVVQNFDQSNVPTSFSYNFTETSCDEVTTSGLFDNAFDIRILASNPCGSSAATVEPIELSTPPVANFIITPPAHQCPDEIWTFTDNSTNINEVISGNPTVCKDSIPPSWQITPGSNGNEWTIVSGNLFASEVLKVRFHQVGTYTIKMTVTSAICGPSTITKTITVLEPPTADANLLSSAPNGCVPSTITLDNFSTGYQTSYLWDISPDTGWSFTNGTNANSENPVIIFTVAGTYDIELATSNICDIDTWDTTITLLAPPIINWSDIPDYCLSATLNFSSSNISFTSPGTPISSYNWSFPGATPPSSTSQYPTNIVYNTPGTYTVTVSATNICGTTTLSQTFVVQSPTVVTMPSNFQICENAAPVQLNATPNGGTWSGPGVSAQGLFDPSNANIGTNTLTYTYGNGICSSTANLVATVVPLPTVNAGPNQAACENILAVTLNGTPAGGTWTSSPGGVLNGDIFNPSASGTGTYTLTYTFTSAQGCTNSDNLLFTVNPLPLLSANDTTYCNTPGTVQLPFATPPGGNWTGTGISNNLFSPITAGGLGTYDATYTYTNLATNCTNSITVQLNVINPASVNAGPDTAFCLSVTAYNLATLASPPGGTWSMAGNGLNGSIFNPLIAGPGTHPITYSVGAGNCLVTDLLTITVHPLLVVNAGSDMAACVDISAVTLNGTPAGGTWTSSPGGVLNGDIFNPSASGPGTYTLTYSLTSAQGCTSSDNLLFTVNPLPLLSANDTTYCNTPGTVQLPFATPLGGTWTGTGISSNLFSPTAAGGVGTYDATYTYTNQATNCNNSITVQLNVINPASVNAGPDTAFCLSVTAYNLATLASPPGGTWSMAGNGLNGSIFNPLIAGPGTHPITYSVGAGNCLVTDLLTITVHPLPNVSAGNNDDACVSENSVALSGSPALGTWSGSQGAVLNGNIFEPNSSGTGSYTLTYSYIDSLGCSNTDEILLVVNPLPILITNDTVYCNTPGLVQLPFTSPSGGNWAGIGTNNGNFDPVGAGGVGTYTLTYSYSDSNGCSDSIQIDVTVIEPAVIEAGANDTVCVNQTAFQLTGFSPSGGTWIGAGIIDPTNGWFDPSIAGGGTKSLVYSVGVGNCEVRDSIEIYVIDIDMVPGDDLAACLLDSPIQMTGFSPLGGYWAGNGVVDSVMGIFDPNLAGVGTHTLTYFFEDPILGCIFSATKTVIVHPMPQSYFEAPAEACINLPVNFINLSQNTYQVIWDFGDGSTSDEVNPSHSYTQIGLKTITLSTTTEHGCSDSYSLDIFVTEPPTLSFSTSVDEGCAVLGVDFINSSSGYEVSYAWNFGNGQTDTIYQPSTIFFEGGTKDTTYLVSLTVSNQCSTLTQIDTILVFPLPQINFSPSIDTSCSPMVVSFANLSVGNPESFYWDFGNMVTSTDSLPGPMTYYTDTVFTTYTITLIAENFCGADTATQEIVVVPSNVDAFFNLPNNMGCQPWTVQFTNYSTPGTSVFWDFGDGNTSSLPNPTHTYEIAGDFKVIQYASTGCGYDSTIANITVLPAPILDFEHLPAVCRGDSIQFFNTTLDDLSGTKWFFGDNDSSFLNAPFHIYQTAGDYTVLLFGTSTLTGCTAKDSSSVHVWELPTVAFAPSEVDGCTPLTITFDNQSNGATYFNWDFGDGNTAIGISPTHTFSGAGSYSVSLTGTDLNGCSDTSQFNYIQVYPIPTADFQLDRDRLCGIPVVMTTLNQSQGALGYQWDFGDGGSSSLVSPVHEYLAQGYYQIILIAENTYLCRDTLAKPFNVYPTPLADFEVIPGIGCEPLEVEFLNTATGSNGYQWRFGDGQTATDFEPVHTYSTQGNYDVQLVANFDNVCFDTLTVEGAVTVLPSPFANFTFEELQQGVPLGIIQFENLSEDAISYYWDFGDGGESTEAHPVHRYYENGIWQVLLEATGSNGCKDDTLLQVTPAFFRGLFIPNAFSPEQGIGEVRLFKPKGVGLKEYKIEVFSPYGQLVWKSESIQDGQPAATWDGKLNGQLLPQDVYVWKAYAIFEDGTVWQGMPDKKGNLKTMGSLILLR